MGKINGCIKCLFIFFNVLFAILGCMLMFAAVKASVYSLMFSQLGGPSLVWIWVFAIGVLGISILGIVAACYEKDLILRIFAGFMGLGMIIMLIFGIVVVVARNKVKESFDSAASDLGKTLMNNDESRAILGSIQQSAHCCGLGGSADWGDDIPVSCQCSPEVYPSFGASTCKAKPQGSRGPDQIYTKGCGEFIFMYVNIFFQICMGFCFGFAVTALLGLLITILMIHQVKRYDSSGGTSIAMKGY
ncbi:23 kDa integral membrane protein-like [Sander lucioperca]|uniref:23 kDa integral membrane protein-like n=1 Tax=Sander lucioperca TaxID=283035 RepID=UPI00125DB324|nr:23 kDa integral membrane protein-like [Sander lucioperca]